MFSDVIRRLLNNSTAPAAAPLKVCDRFADVRLTNQFREQVDFRRDLLNGRAIVVNSMYTTCRGSCPVTSAAVEQLRAKLSPVFGDKLVFVSFTLEPKVDTPERLRKYAATYGADVRHKTLSPWHFLTGQADDLESLRISLGLYDLNPKIDQDITAHASVLMFGNAVSDRWATLPAAMRTGVLVDAIRRTCGFTFEQKYGIKG